MSYCGSRYVAAGFTENSRFVVNKHIKGASTAIKLGELVKLHFDDLTDSPKFITINSCITFYARVPLKDTNDDFNPLRYIGEVGEKVKDSSLNKSANDFMSEYSDMMNERINGLVSSAERIAAKAEYMRKVHMAVENVVRPIDISDIDFHINVFRAVIKMLQHIKNNNVGELS